MHERELHGALDAFDRALKLAPWSAVVQRARAQALSELGRGAEAIEAMTDALSNEPSAPAFVERGRLLLMDKVEAAAVDFAAALALDPTSASARVSRGVALRRLGRYEEALVDLTLAVELAPSEAQIWAERGETYRLLAQEGDRDRVGERLERALADFSRAIEFGDNYIWAIASRGQVYLALLDAERAERDFARARKDLSLESHRENVWVLVCHGQALRELKRFDEALAALTCAIESGLPPPRLDKPWHCSTNPRARIARASASSDVGEPPLT